jgi:hypothetical protein
LSDAKPFGYKALIEQNPDLYTVEVIGTKVGKSAAYALGRLKLIELFRRRRRHSMRGSSRWGTLWRSPNFTVTYYGCNGEVHIESYPAVEVK